jgi:hypothetical protein
MPGALVDRLYHNRCVAVQVHCLWQGRTLGRCILQQAAALVNVSTSCCASCGGQRALCCVPLMLQVQALGL